MERAAHLPPTGKRETLVGLDLIRFGTATLVMVYHLLFWRNGQMPTDGPGKHLWFGWIGVEIFFVLSGYVIAYSAHHSTANQFGTNRFLRLAPGIWICGSLTFCFSLFLGEHSPTSLFDQLLRTLTLFPFGNHVDVGYWTLPIEVSFYLLVYVVLRFSRFGMLMPLCIIVAIFSTLYLATLLTIERNQGHFLPNLWTDPVIWLSSRTFSRFLLLPHGCFFSLGVGLWALQEHPKSIPLWVGTIVAFGGSIAGILLFTDHYIREKGLYDVVSQTPLMVWTLATTLIGVSSRFNGVFNSLHPDLNKWLRFLGLLTFPLYLLHNNIGLQVESLARSCGMNGRTALLSAFGVVILITTVVTWKLEPWTRNMIATQLDRLLHPRSSV